MKPGQFFVKQMSFGETMICFAKRHQKIFDHLLCYVFGENCDRLVSKFGKIKIL